MPIPPAMRGSVSASVELERGRAGLSRRAFVRAAAMSGALAGAGASLGVARATPASAGAALVATDPDLHLLRRATFGPTQSLVKELRRLGRARWLERQLD